MPRRSPPFASRVARAFGTLRAFALAVSALPPSRECADGHGRGRALGYFALGAWIAIVWIALPVGIGLFLGALLAFTLQPLYGKLRARRWRDGPAALACTLGATVIVSSAVTALALVFITRGVELVASLPSLLAAGGGLRTFVEKHRGTMAWLDLSPESLGPRVEAGARSLVARAATIAADIAGATASGALTLFFAAMATYYVLRRWSEIVRYLETTLPLEPRHTHALLDQFRRVGRQTLRGTLVTGCVQGGLAAIGYAVTGAPDPFFFGVLTAVASLLPAVGTMLVWLPMGVYLVATGRAVSGIVELAWGALVVVVVSDYVVRPKLVGDDSGVPPVLTFVALFGGLEVFGVAGLVVGPVIVALAVAILRTYHDEIARAANAR